LSIVPSYAGADFAKARAFSTLPFYPPTQFGEIGYVIVAFACDGDGPAGRTPARDAMLLTGKRARGAQPAAV
jgi:hypothetical protein